MVRAHIVHNDDIISDIRFLRCGEQIILLFFLFLREEMKWLR